MNKKNVLYVKNLNKTYSKNSSKSILALKDLNLEVNEGEIFGFEDIQSGPFIIDVDGFEGPLHLLLELARAQT